MTIASEITRLQWAKATARTSIINKWVSVPASASVEDYHTYIDQIQQWNPFTTTMPIRYILDIDGTREWRADIECKTSFVYGDYMFWTVSGSTFTSTYDVFKANFLVYKKGWTDIKYINGDSSTSRDRFYYRQWGYSISWNNITLGLGYTTDRLASGDFNTITATFDMSTEGWTSTWSGSTTDLTIKSNELFDSIEFDPKIYNSYWTKTPVVIFNLN